MNFSDTTDLTGIVEHIDFLLNTDATAYPLKQKARCCNAWYERVVSLILKADGRWEWDDENLASDPIYTANLVANTQSYALSGATFLKTLKVEIKNEAGDWIALQPISLDDRRSGSMTDFMKTAGTPQYYDKLGNKIWLYPKPSYASTNGLKIYYQRKPDLFASTDTTQAPGFASPFHKILALGAALDYCLAKGIQEKVNLLREEIAIMEAGIISFYSDRGHDEKQHMSLRKENYGAYGEITNHFYS